MAQSLEHRGAPPALVASGLGDDTGGGMYLLAADPAPRVEAIDALSTTGVAVADDGAALARLLFTDDDPQVAGELLLYDARGVACYRRVDALQEPHAAIWHRGMLVVVSTLANAILWLDASGTLVRSWQAPGDGGDCWHVNSLAVRDGRLVASAFGRFATHRGWARADAREGRGVVFDVETGADLVTGLTCPHDPLPFEGGWLVCNSGERELLRTSAGGEVLQRVPLGGWTRGLLLDDAHVYVGVSASRQIEAEGRARVVALDRATLTEVYAWEMPCREVYAFAFAPPPLLAGLRTGFATNAFRLREGVGIDHGGPVARWLDAPDRRVRIAVEEAPATATAGDWLSLRWSVVNAGGGTLASGGDHSVVIGAWWLRDGAEVPRASARARLPSIVEPGASMAGVLRLPVPAEPGGYGLHVGVGQEGIGWLEPEIGGLGGWDGLVEVRPHDVRPAAAAHGRQSAAPHGRRRGLARLRPRSRGT